MNPTRRLSAVARILLLAVLAAGAAHAQVTIVHSFTGTDGAEPTGDVTVVGGVIYGLTSVGGASEGGTIFGLGAAGFPLSLPTDSAPLGGLTRDGTKLFGVTSGGGSFGAGRVFEISTSGGDPITRHDFTGVGGSRAPGGSLLLTGGVLYGVTRGTVSAPGTVFRLGVDGSPFQTLHTFTSAEGSFPVGTPTLVGSRLYGLTNSGTLYGVGLDGGAFEVVHTFAASAPEGSLLAIGSTVYGTTSAGGTNGNGTVFRFDLTGGGLEVLRNFAGGETDGALPTGGLTLVGSTLYGTTQTGGAFGLGTVFRMNLDGGNFEIVHSFAGFEAGGADGISPQRSLVLADGLLYGTTAGGGEFGQGTVFSVVPVPEPSALALVLGAVTAGLLLRRRHR